LTCHPAAHEVAHRRSRCGSATAGKPIRSGEEVYRDPEAKRGTACADIRGGPMTDREKRIREIAHHLWVQEGRPEGRSDSHWQEAVALYEAESAQSKDGNAKPPTEPAAEKPARSGAKKTAEATAGKKTTAEPNAQKPASAGKPKPAEPARKPAEKPASSSKKKPPAK
jgi:hypothetical protein